MAKHFIPMLGEEVDEEDLRIVTVETPGVDPNIEKHIHTTYYYKAGGVERIVREDNDTVMREGLSLGGEVAL